METNDEKKSRVTFDEQPEKECPKCGNDCVRDSVHNGVGILYGPYGCPSCAWSEDERYDLSDKSKSANKEGGIIDQYGGWTRQPEAAGQEQDLPEWVADKIKDKKQILELQEQTASLQKQLEEERKSNHLLHQAMRSAEDRGVAKGREESKSRIAQLEEALKECRRLVTIDRSGRSGNRLNEVSEIVDKILQSPPGESEKENNNP